MANDPEEFDFEKLDVYRVASEFLKTAEKLAAQIPRSRQYLKDQLLRAALSIQANIAEGAGEFSPLEKARFYRIAKRSATESTTLLKALVAAGINDAATIATGRTQLFRIVSMLTKMIIQQERRKKNP